MGKKYKIEDLDGIAKNERMVMVGIMIANELHKLNGTLGKFAVNYK